MFLRTWPVVLLVGCEDVESREYEPENKKTI